MYNKKNLRHSIHAYSTITILYTQYHTSLWVCLSCKTVDAKLSILFPDDMMENAKNMMGNKYNHGYFGYFIRNPFNVSEGELRRICVM